MEFRDRIKEFPHIETERLVLRQISEDDANDLYTYYTNPELYRHLDWNGPQSVIDAKETIGVWNQGFTDGWIIRWAIVLKEIDTIIGTIFLSEFELKWGMNSHRSIGTKALCLKQLKKYYHSVLKTIGLHRIQATIEPENRASIKLVEKYGFRNEGLLKGYNFNETTSEFTDL